MLYVKTCFTKPSPHCSIEINVTKTLSMNKEFKIFLYAFLIFVDCTEDEFQCTSDVTCIALTAVCNGVSNCHGGEDELNCHGMIIKYK